MVSKMQLTSSLGAEKQSPWVCVPRAPSKTPGRQEDAAAHWISRKKGKERASQDGEWRAPAPGIWQLSNSYLAPSFVPLSETNRPRGSDSLPAKERCPKGTVPRPDKSFAGSEASRTQESIASWPSLSPTKGYWVKSPQAREAKVIKQMV